MEDTTSPIFDPYASQLFRTGSHPATNGVNALLEEKVATMQARREEEVLSAGIPARETQVYHASNTPMSSSVELPLSYSSKVDAQVLKNAFHETRQARSKQEHFQTKAMREFEFLKGRIGSTVHTKATIKVQFPDGWIFSANFSPLETLTEVEAEIKRNMRNPHKAPFYLFERPRHERLACNHSLAHLGFVPSTKLFAAWEEEAPEGEYFNNQVLRGSTPTSNSKPKSKSKPKPKSVSGGEGHAKSKRKSLFALFKP